GRVGGSAPRGAGPRGVVKAGICKPICTPIASAVGVSDADSHSLLPPVTPGLIRVPHNGVMTQPVIKTRTLVTDDGVPIEAMHLPKGGDLAIVLPHGFTLSWQHGAGSNAARWLHRSRALGGVG